MGFEPTTLCLGSRCSTPELLPLATPILGAFPLRVPTQFRRSTTVPSEVDHTPDRRRLEHDVSSGPLDDLSAIEVANWLAAPGPPWVPPSSRSSRRRATSTTAT
jgi:hypothetical protein